MSIWWKIYFVTIAIQLVGSPAAGVVTSTFGPLDLVNLGFMAVGVIGLYRFVFEKQTDRHEFWRMFLPALIAWDVFYILAWVPSLNSGTLSPPESMQFIVIAMLIPQYVALFRYAHQPFRGKGLR